MKALICGVNEIPYAALEWFKSHNIDITLYRREDEKINDDNLDSEIIICNWLFQHIKIQEFKHLETVHLLSAGYDRVPLDYFHKNNIRIFNARGVYDIPIAEYCVGAVLQFAKKFSKLREAQKMKLWQKERNCFELSDKTLIIVGAGSVGCEIAKKFSLFVYKIIGIDLHVDHRPYFDRVEHFDKLKEILKDGDIVISSLPLNESTKSLFSKETFKSMKKGSIFLNVGRGEVVDQEALKWALEERLYGAAIDVFEREPIPLDDTIWEYDNLIITPHNSFVSDLNEKRLWELIISNLGEIYG